MDIPTLTRFRRVDIGVRIHPNDGHLAVQPFPDGFRGAGDGPYGDGVVAPERQDAAALLRVLVDLLAEPLRDGADGEWVFHVAVIGVRGRHDGGVGVDGVVVEEVIAEVFLELGQETGGDESCGRGIDAGFALFCFWGLLRSPRKEIGDGDVFLPGRRKIQRR